MTDGHRSVVLRVLFVIAVIATGGLVLLIYLVAWAALPASGEDGRRSLGSVAWRRFGVTGGLRPAPGC